MRHVPSQINQDGFHGKVSFPMVQARQLGGINLASLVIHAGQIDFGEEGYDWG
jgi:hypothetical protein